jgi:hypothetical protein
MWGQHDVWNRRHVSCWIFLGKTNSKKGLKTPESINRKRTNSDHQKKRDNRTNSDLQNTENQRSSKTNSPKYWGELRCSGRVGNSCSTSSTHRVNLFTKPDLGLSWLSYIQRGNAQGICRKICLMVAIGWESDVVLNANSDTFYLYHGENKLIYNEMTICWQ